MPLMGPKVEERQCGEDFDCGHRPIGALVCRSGGDGGDRFTVLIGGTDRLGGEIDLDALVAYFGANSPVPPGPQDRITRLN